MWGQIAALICDIVLIACHAWCRVTQTRSVDCIDVWEVIKVKLQKIWLERLRSSKTISRGYSWILHISISPLLNEAYRCMSCMISIHTGFPIGRLDDLRAKGDKYSVTIPLFYPLLISIWFIFGPKWSIQDSQVWFWLDLRRDIGCNWCPPVRNSFYRPRCKSSSRAAVSQLQIKKSLWEFQNLFQ